MKHLICTLLLFSSLSACAQQPVPGPTADRYAPVMVPSLPEALEFAGETVPLENYDTRESLLREVMTNAYLHSRTTQTLLSTTRYFPMIEPILKKNGIPDDFKYLCMAESGLDPDVRSGAGAAGLWQLMPPFAKSVGVFIGDGVDDRYHIEKATEAACKYLIDAKNRLGSWTLAAASYNVGVAGVNKRLQKQGVSSYYDLFLPDETMRYLFRVLAFKLITPNPLQYGYQLAEQSYYPPLTDYREVTLDDAVIDWAVVARANGTTYKMLRELNHWIRDYDYDNKARRQFVIRVPNQGFRVAK